MFDLSLKELVGVASLIVGGSAYIPYVWLVLKKRVRPHAFSFLIWAVSTGTVFFAQTVSGGGAGAWGNGMWCVLTGSTFLLALLYHGERDIHRVDWASLLVALLGIGLWIATSTPLWSVVILTAIDAVGYIPTYRKTYRRPHEESALLYTLGTTSMLLSLLALESYNTTTVLYPAVIIPFNAAVVALVILRSRQLKTAQET